MFFLFMAVMAGNFSVYLITQPTFYRSLMYPFYRLTTYIQRRRFQRQHSNFFNPPKPDKTKRNILFLCHGRNQGVPTCPYNIERDPAYSVLQTSIYNCYTVDIDINAWPHYNHDALDEELYNRFEDNTFDFVVLFNCSCHTVNINNSTVIMSKIKRILKEEGQLLIKQESFDMRSNGFIPKTKYWLYFNTFSRDMLYSEYILTNYRNSSMYNSFNISLTAYVKGEIIEEKEEVIEENTLNEETIAVNKEYLCNLINEMQKLLTEARTLMQSTIT